MRAAIIGSGKTGSEVIKLLPDAAIYNRKNPPTIAALSDADVAIVFTPAEAVSSLCAILLEAQIPAVWGSTGFEWPKAMDQQLKEAGLSWIYSANFSLGMAVMQKVLQQLEGLMRHLNQPKCQIVETHHNQKVDAPSGTALSWQKWFGHPVEIESIREGDIVGNHRLEIETENEKLLFEHQAKSRKIFAEGAVFAASQIASCEPGLHHFSKLLEGESLCASSQH